MATKFTGLKYDSDCGYYAVRNGRIVCPIDGISGMKADAERALAWASIDWHSVELLPEAERWANEPGY
ncbi:MAG: hypothetical protein DDT21_01882 [Syntrophomonadaceae bacterium]|nr:hypothetical protein [Bacillota bacterium]